MGDTTLATFRVDKDTWKEFKQWASDRGSNASTELNKFILRSLGRIDSNLDVNIDSRDNRIDEDIDKRIENYLDSNLDERIEETVKRYLDDNLEQQMYEATLKSIDRDIDKDIDTNPDQNIDKNLDSERETSLDTNIDDSLDKAQCIDTNIDKNIDKDQTTKNEETSVTESVGEEEVIEPLADEKGLSGKELASLLGVRSEYLTRWKSGKSIPKEDSENYQAYQDFCNYRWQKKKGSNQAKYYQIKN